MFIIHCGSKNFILIKFKIKVVFCDAHSSGNALCTSTRSERFCLHRLLCLATEDRGSVGGADRAPWVSIYNPHSFLRLKLTDAAGQENYDAFG